MRYWTYTNQQGTWSIRHERDLWHVFLDDFDLGGYSSPQTAVEELAGGYTFFPPSELDPATCELPDNLAEWDAHEEH